MCGCEVIAELWFYLKLYSDSEIWSSSQCKIQYQISIDQGPRITQKPSSFEAFWLISKLFRRSDLIKNLDLTVPGFKGGRPVFLGYLARSVMCDIRLLSQSAGRCPNSRKIVGNGYALFDVLIVAVILCNTGIALLAYMDGITKTKTLGGVVLAAAAAAGSAVYKVLFKKVIGEASFGQVSFIFTIIALLNTVLLSPLVAAFYFSGYEVIEWRYLPWPNLVIAAALSLAANLLGNFAIAFTFEIFITLGLVLAVPVSAVLDTKWYAVEFEGMKLAGVVLIMCGFFLVLFPANWPEYITKVLRWGRHRKRNQPRQQPEPVDYRTGLISRSHLRSPSGLIR
ncbi:putative thiamine transporter SLC35F3 [Penaeus japonicus]|uniref:putative thiamine transporter SLC35F3 n=1 Tax=Penaeus japonicus TaxID=27405 RepID=UPI001C713099|nr:putative thiamine transporter SLC35F3 [Penaeus japonicus]